MKSVKATWDNAPSGPKKEASLTHYKTAEAAHKAQNDDKANKELDAEKHGLA
jgi:hypothetical protein